MIAVHTIDRIGILLAWIGVLSLAWACVHGWRLWRQWRDHRRKPGKISWGLWTLFACLATVALLGLSRRWLPDWHIMSTITELALLGVAGALTWLVWLLVRLR